MTRLSGYQGTRHMSPQAARQETDRGGHYRHLPLAYLQPLGGASTMELGRESDFFA